MAVEPPIEFLPWYGPANQFTRCSRCGAVVLSTDQQVHEDWHWRDTSMYDEAGMIMLRDIRKRMERKSLERMEREA